MPLPAALTALHRELGIPSSYAAERSLEPQPEAPEPDLVLIAPNDDGRPIRLLPAAAHAWTQMRDAAAQEGIILVPMSGFRSVARQVELIRTKLTSGQSIDAILRYVAAPGFSEHHTGRALDIADRTDSDLDETFERTTAFGWLARRAVEFQFHLSYPRGNPHGIGYEPWHWCWRTAR
jgi:D-alanyl-D-alanine carboxypeptidase